MDVVRSILCCSPTESFKLLDAAKAGDAVVAASIIQQRPKLARTAQQWGGQTAWHIAARDGHADVLTAMADSIKATDLTFLRSVWGTDLGDTTDDILESLVQYQDTKGLSPLHLACIKGKTAAVDVLMKLGANPFAMDSVGRTPLHYAASWGFADCINAVLGHHSGPPKEGWLYTWPNNGETRLVDVQNAAGFTPLHYAVWVGRKQAIQALASYDASLKVVNSGNDFEWIKVGSGNTPLHLAAFGGDMQVVKLLLAAYVQSLAAGAEVMTAGRGQWGNRHTDDVRHIRNRRGWMPYHIAIHKGYEHLAELLHPDIPYTFIFSNEDMAPGSVRMYGPARLMVIAAKALQQKLVDELAQVEAATALDKPAAAGAVTITAAAPAPDGDISELVGADQGIAAVAPAVIGAPVGSTPAAEPAAAAGGAAPSVVSPFAARSGRGWASFSAGASEPTSVATSISAAVATPTVGSAVGTPAGSISNPAAGAAPAAAAAAVAAATAAAAAVEVSPTGTDHTEHSFSAADMQSQAAGTSTVAGLPTDGGSFAGFAVMQQQPQPCSSAAAAVAGSSDMVGWQQRGDNASVSDAGLSSSTIPASNAAVAGSAPGSISMGPVSRDSSMHKLQHGMLLAPIGQPVTTVEANSTTRSVQWAPMQGSSSNAGSNQNLPAVSVQQQQQQGSKHRRVQSATGVYSRQGSRGLSDTAAGVRADDQQQSKFPWARMESMKRRNSKKDFSEWLPPSAVQTCADDDADSHGNHTHPQNAATTSSRRSSQDNAASGSSQPLMRRISSLPIRIGSRVGPAAAAAAATATAEPATGQPQWQQQPHRASFDVSLQHPVHENPLNVVLAARAQQIGDNPEAIRQQLLAMKLASGALQFDNAISTFTTSVGSPLETERAVSRFASFSHNPPISSRNSISSRPGVTGTVSPAAPAAAQQPTAAVVEAAAAAAAAALPSIHSSDAGTSSSPFAAFAAPQEQQQAAQVDSLDTQQQRQQQQASLSPSPSLFNITAANVISQQPSQSLQRLLSGSSRGRRAASTAPPQQQSAGSSIPGVTSGDVAGSLSTSPSPAAAGRDSANGELPIVQLQYTTAVAAMISEGSSGIDEDDLCEICFDAAAVVALQQCGHTLCVGCCKELCKLHHFKPGLCPYCRQIICGFERATHVFIP